MDHYQSVVVEYLRADRAVFVNTECCIQINEGLNPDISGPHWYCDAVALDLRRKCVFLCEISYAKSLTSLLKRLKEWSAYWEGLRTALVRDCKVDATWSVRPWVFAPKDLLEKHHQVLKGTHFDGLACEVTALEQVQPWNYCSWDRPRELTGSQKEKAQEIS